MRLFALASFLGLALIGCTGTDVGSTSQSIACYQTATGVLCQPTSDVTGAAVDVDGDGQVDSFVCGDTASASDSASDSTDESGADDGDGHHSGGGGGDDDGNDNPLSDSDDADSDSDSNADYQGDWIALDPRAPNVYGKQAGNIEHLFKAYGSYEFDFGLEASAVFNWNSGALFTPAEAISRRYFPPMADPAYEFGGVTDTYFLPGYVGAETTPDYYTFDMRFKYDYELPFGNVELFLDVFNVLNQQFKTNVEKQIAGSGQYDFNEANAWVAPRRAYLGARFSF